MKAILLNTVLTFSEDNNFSHNKILTKGFRFSIWKDENDFTACEIYEIDDSIKQVMLGETKKVKLMVLPTKMAYTLKEGDTIYWGVPHTKVGQCKIVDTPIEV